MSIPSQKDRKYDRQLRLWAASGQSALESAHICLVGATAVGSELAKNLVLPGVGRLTVVDNATVTKEDTSSNFFVEQSKAGLSRAKVVADLLQELNPEVKTRGLDVDPKQFATSERDWTDYSLVIVSGVDYSVALALNERLYDLNIPLMVVDSLGFYGYLRISKREHTIVDTHPESLVDLRILDPWPELEAFRDSFDLNSLDSSDLAHVPYVVILLIYLEQWKSEHGRVPQNYAEKKELRDRIAKGGSKTDSENFDEAYGAVLRAVQPSDVPVSIKQLMEEGSRHDIGGSNFWVLVCALREFVMANGGLLPLPGALPDMKADTLGYVKLQNIYKAKARADFEKFKSIYTALLAEAGRPGAITDEEGELFCKNARFIRYVPGSKLEYKVASVNISPSSDPLLLPVYVAIRAVKKYIEEKNEVPGKSEDVVDLSEEIAAVLDSISGVEIDSNDVTKVVQEIVRSGSSEVHNIAAFMGGVGGQEAVKLITTQYGVLDNAVVYDGISASTRSYKF
ncbi:NEDD8-activating enzyme E1 regulatory subunit [Trichomonascus vanleenenianus]|uniref:Ula1p n=1 Tax=Trichomonascus vanleenenianus TaxID=2268995 RepID=UPI003EC9BBB1